MTCVNDSTGSELPWDILKYKKNMRFSVIGLTGAGKTTFLITMLHELRSATNLWSASPMDRDTRDWYTENERILYRQHMQVEPTNRIEGENILPLRLWKIQDLLRKSKKNTPTYTLTIFDGAGEDCAQISEI